VEVVFAMEVVADETKLIFELDRRRIKHARKHGKIAESPAIDTDSERQSLATERACLSELTARDSRRRKMSQGQV